MRSKVLSNVIALAFVVCFALLAIFLGVSDYLVLLIGSAILLFRRRINRWRIKALAKFALFMLDNKLPGHGHFLHYVEKVAHEATKTPKLRKSDKLQHIVEKSEREWQAAVEKDKDRVYTEDEIAAYFDAHSDPVVYLIREWGGQGSFTQIGGLPQLAPDITWPKHRETGLPLHFLAQINLAEVPTTPDTTMLPRTGTLWFFVDLTDDSDGDTAEQRVLYHSECDPGWQRVRQTSDLPAIAEHVRRQANKQGHQNTAILPQSNMACVVHPCLWQENELPKDRGVNIMRKAFDYSQTHKQDTFAQTVQSSGITKLVPPAHDGPNYCPDVFGGHFPWTNLVATKLTQPITRLVKLRNFEKRTENIEQAEQLLADLQTAPPMTKLSPEHQARFDDCIFKNAGYESAQAARDSGDDLIGLRTSLHSALRTIKTQADVDPDLLAALPKDLLRGFMPYRIAESSNDTMIGGPKFANPNPTPGTGFKLLQVDSDNTLGVTWGDMGLVEFWIDPNDLAALDFGKTQFWISSG